jgi:hypothetical protein
MSNFFPTDLQAPPDGVDLRAQFARMCDAFAHHGGTVHADEVVGSMRGRVEQPISVLAKRIVAREVIAIEWRHTLLVPMFQLNEHSMNPKPACRDIVSELSDVMDDWTIALWFATCNPLLDGVPPVDMLSPRWDRPLQAARVTRQVRTPTRGIFAAPLIPEHSVYSTEDSRWKQDSDRSEQA